MIDLWIDRLIAVSLSVYVMDLWTDCCVFECVCDGFMD